jgi:hypothetical protein
MYRLLDAEDFPHRYYHNEAKWAEWLVANNKTVTRVNTGGSRVEPQGFERVFFDDFRVSRLSPSTSNEGDLWQGFGFNVAVGGSAKLKNGVPKAGGRQDFIIDYVEVLQKTADLERVPAPFTARPTLNVSGGKITCAANVTGVTDLRYYWFADGYPLTFNANNNYEPTLADAGKTIRCMVKVVGALNQPEAWTAGVKLPR